MRDWLVRAEQEMAAKLLTRAERRDLLIEHELSGLLRGDTAGRAEYYRTMSSCGLMTPNEIRRLENLPDHADGADQLF